MDFIIHMWHTAPTETRVAALLALLTGLFGVFWSLFRYVQLETASRRLNSIEVSPDNAESNWNLVQGLKSISSFNQMILRLNRIRQVGNSEPESAWRAAFELLANAAEQNEAIVKSLASVAVLLGLAGTVLGFARLAEPLLSIRQGAVSVSITNELAGAFVATLAGILGAAFILVGAIPILRTAQDNWLEAVEDVGRLVIIPSLPRPPTKIQDIILQELKRRLDTIAQAWTSALAQPAEQLSAVARASRSSVEKLGEALNAIPPETLKDLATSARSIRAAATSIAKSSANYQSSAGELAKVASAFETALRDLTIGMATNTSKIEFMRQVVSDSNGEIRFHGNAVVTSVGSMAMSFKELATTVGERMAQETKILESADRSTANIAAHLQELNKTAQELYIGARELMLASSAVKDAVTPLPEQNAAALAKWLQAFQREEELVLGHFRTRLESLADISTNLSKAAEALASIDLTSLSLSYRLRASKATDVESVGSSVAKEALRASSTLSDSRQVDRSSEHEFEQPQHSDTLSGDTRASGTPEPAATVGNPFQTISTTASSSDSLEESESTDRIHQLAIGKAESTEVESVLSKDTKQVSAKTEALRPISVTTQTNGPVKSEFETQPLERNPTHARLSNKASRSWFSRWFKRSGT
jgi:biopolymer transport protein ExbB/TolQ